MSTRLVLMSAFGLLLADLVGNPISAQLVNDCESPPYGLASTLDGQQVIGGMAVDTGRYTSIAIRADCRPLISHYHQTEGRLSIFDCADAACTNGQAHNLTEALSGRGTESRLAIGTNGLPIISFRDLPGNTLGGFHCSDQTCSTGTELALEPGRVGGRHSSIAIRDDRRPIISYYDVGRGALAVFDCFDTSCSEGVSRRLDNVANVGDFSSVAIGLDGLPIISYAAITGDDLKIYACSDVDCVDGEAYVADSVGAVGRYSSIAVRPDGLPIVSYFNLTRGDLQVYDCFDTVCSVGEVRTLDETNGFAVGVYSSIAVGAQGLPVISYAAQSGAVDSHLKFYSCADSACETGAFRTIDSADGVGDYSSLAVRSNGLPIISYYDRTNGDLKVYSCGDPDCDVLWAGGFEVSEP